MIATFHEPADPNYDRGRFFELMRQRGFVMFRGQLTVPHRLHGRDRRGGHATGGARGRGRAGGHGRA